jgi:hypothetical protein
MGDHLNKGTSPFFLFPRGRLFARLQLDHNITQTDGFARFHRQIAPQAIAFVENS